MNRILFVDDEPHLLAGLRRMLQIRQGVGWAMSFVDGGTAALEAMQVEPFDVVVSDFRMPGIDGAQLLAEVQVRYPQTVRLILSGYTEQRDLATLASLAHQFLTKPCDPGELKRTVELTLTLGRQCGDEHVRAEMSGISTLPSSPSALQHLVAVLGSASCDPKLVAKALQRDVALSAKVLQLVNSSFFAPSRRTTSLEEAVLRLGVQTIRSLVLAVLASRASTGPDPAGPGRPDELQRLNDHALETARLARRLAQPAERDDAGCAGLLHVCGQLALVAGGPDAFGETAAHAGAYLLTLWGLPAEVVEAVACLSDPVEARPDRHLDLVSVVQVAHVLVESEHIGSCGWSGVPVPDRAWLEAAGVFDEVSAWKAEQRARVS
ncbi:MAG: HDOD domain-containing protein [Actinobacteria bacterium]|nr:MAG: HDOD domain-containing protein [Actinomycetota bacterium]